MKTLLLTLIALNLYAASFLRQGDILMQPLHCRLCSLIEDETNSIYSHIGVVIETYPEVIVAEAYITTRKLSLVEFNKKTQKNQRLKVLRPRFNTPGIMEYFEREFEGLPYDRDFLWADNAIYCSELVYKLLSAYSNDLPSPKGMIYSKNYEAWKKYFKHEPPSGKLGMTPAAFDEYENFIFMGYL